MDEKEYFFKTETATESDMYGSREYVYISLYKATISKTLFGKSRSNICRLAYRRASKNKDEIERTVEELRSNAMRFDEEYEREKLRQLEIDREKLRKSLEKREKELALSNLLSSINSQSFTSDNKIS